MWQLFCLQEFQRVPSEVRAASPHLVKGRNALPKYGLLHRVNQYGGFLVVEIDEIAASLTVLQSKSFENRGECNKLNKTQWKSRKEWGLQPQTQ